MFGLPTLIFLYPAGHYLVLRFYGFEDNHLNICSNRSLINNKKHYHRCWE